MDRRQTLLGIAAALAVGCAPRPPAPTPPPVVVAAPPTVAPPVVAAPATVVALLEPYLVADSPPRLEPPPAPLGGRIVPIEPSVPLSPAPPTVTRPLDPPPTAKAPSAKPTPRSVSPALVRLFEEERTRAVDAASRQAAAAATRATQTIAEAKKTWELVRAGALAQFKADQSDAAARAAATDKAEADKALEEAQERRRNARRDVEAALGAVASVPSGFALAQTNVALPIFRSVPFTYRLSILGASASEVKVENGTLGRSLATGKGEAGAWIVRCLDPSKLRVRVGTAQAELVTRSLPKTEPVAPRV